MKKVFLILLFVLSPVVVFAEVPEYGSAFNRLLVDYLIPSIGALVLGFVTVILELLRRKLNIEVSKETEKQLFDLAKKSVAFAEEWAANKIKVEGKVASESKFDKAMEYFLSNAPNVDKEKMYQHLISALGSMYGFGASEDRGLPE